MKLAILVLVAALGLAAANGPAHIPRDVCFKKVETTHCCYKFRTCGHVLVKRPFTVRCDFKECKRVCTPKCEHVCKRHKVRVPKRVCHTVYKRVCHFVKDRRGHPVRVCKRVPRHVCKHRFHIVVQRKCHRVCRKHCRRVCHKVHAICHKVRILKFVKFCPRLVCGRPTVTGHIPPPRHVVGKKGVLVRVVHVSRKIVPRKHPRY